MSLSDSIGEFRAGVSQVNAVLEKAYEVDSDGNEIFDELQQEFIVSSAFLRMFIHWETFVEASFASYLIGERSVNGTSVSRCVTPSDRDHALKILVGTQKYVDWANHEIVRRLANLYLEDGEPFSSNISAIARDLSDLKTVRNAAAHLSSTTQHQLDALASRVLGRAVSNFTVANFILHLDPNDPSKTILQKYQELLDLAAENIAGNVT
ncbi:hypothetical protein [Microbulbifer hydrolyticus]|uniref:RiboL-PSP-HEPN domain-containing protein n=1 Tax=Microbulbifer hydrolyticus TaxID=48074 RepID=A0A6P1TBN9_9GAMM|nr:hypothetical protein [Microbulbifer hydrolyticus]MBB5210529.1 hypothetical protein [Microbulbifer hydrolyticus]QHQ39000.1 hypothetical protein GTQ55_08380 [Microbulbifer hydrolyticus]